MVHARPTASDVVEIAFPTWQAEEPGFSAFWPAMISEFEMAHRGVRVKLAFFPINEFESSVLEPLRRGVGPDIVHFPAQHFWHMQRERLLSPLPWASGDLPILREWHPWQERFVSDGALHAILMQVFGYVMIYWREPFDRTGIVPPTNSTELVEVTQQLQHLVSAAVIDAPCGWTTAKHPVLFREVSQWVLDANTHWAADGRPQVTTGSIREAVIAWHAFITRWGVPLDVEVERKQHSFAEGRSAFIVDGPWVLARVADHVRQGRISVAPVPFKAPAGGLSHALGVARSSERREEAFAFLKWLLRRDTILEYCRRSFSVPPIVTISAQELGPCTSWPTLITAARNARDTVPPGMEAGITQFRDIVVDELVASLHDGEVDKHLARIARRWDEVAQPDATPLA